jgi:shikimate kinase/3-dehydroquinate synthase
MSPSTEMPEASPPPADESHDASTANLPVASRPTTPLLTRHVFFTGFMATGKSRIGAMVAERLGVPFEDTDHWIEARHRKSVSEIFAEQGEAAFREIEIEAIRHLVAESPRVIALGGGSLLHPDALPTIQAAGTLVGLWARAETISARVGRKETRPLLAGLSPEERLVKIKAMLDFRAPLYRNADFQVESADEVSRDQIADQIAAALPVWESRALSVPLGERSYPIFSGTDIARHLPMLCAQAGLRGRPFVVTDANVLAAQGAVIEGWKRAWPQLEVHVFPPGEEHKTLETLQGLFTFLLEHKADRKSFLVAFSGGVGGDMTGFAAACYQRGIDFVQVPTTLLSMVDSSVGGKTAVDHPLGKNMIGAFHQPRLVIADTACLATLPEREYLSGLSEVAKYGVIRDADLFTWLEANAPACRTRDSAAVARMVASSCACKAQIVGEDEHENGVRALLNLGHTFGHALETLAGYGSLLHGEAISLGMLCAGRLSVRRGLWRVADQSRLRSLLTRLGLPTTLDTLPDPAKAWELMARDKKARDGQARFVLPTGIGSAEVVSGISYDEAADAWNALLSGQGD